jgi:hypothetical protein
LVHGKPIGGNLPVDIPIPDCGPFELGSDGLGTACGHKVLHGPVDEAAPLARSGDPVDGANRCFRENDVNAFAHGHPST